MKRAHVILIIGIFLSTLIRGFFTLTGLEVGDVKNMHDTANMLLAGINPYTNSHLYPYPPLYVFVEAGTALFTNFAGTSFHFLIKFWPNLADILITLLLYKFLRKQKVGSTPAALWSLFYILNPITIIISSAHGQFDSIVSLLTILSIYLLSYPSKKLYLTLSPIILGLAISFKANPAMILPVFLIFGKRPLSERVHFLLVTCLTVGIIFLPFLILNFKATLSSVFGYSGVSDFGYAAILRALWYQINAEYWLPQVGDLLSASKITFLLGAALLVILTAMKDNLIRSCLLVYLLFVTVFSGQSAQYLIWVLPLGIMLRDKWVVAFSIAAFFAYLGFYLFFAPELLLGKYFYLAGGFFQTKYMPLYFFGNLMLWFVTALWFLKILKGQLVSFKSLKKPVKSLVLALSVLFLASLIPILNLALQVIQASTG